MLLSYKIIIYISTTYINKTDKFIKIYNMFLNYLTKDICSLLLQKINRL
jgi:hypothetical protein